MIKDPLEEVFNMNPEIDSDNIDDSYSMIQQSAATPTVQEPIKDQKDEDDIDTEAKIDDVYSKALGAFNNLQEYMEIIEPRYAARNSEVAANFLTIALNAANSKAKNKVDRKRANHNYIPYANKTTNNNNFIMADRNEILKMVIMDKENKELK